MIHFVIAILLLFQISYATDFGAINSGQRYRILVSTDLGGSDEDDVQSLIHLLIYADLFDIEGIVSSPPHAGRKQDIIDIIDIYAQDFSKLYDTSPTYPHPEFLKSITKQGATDAAPEKGFSEPTKGSEWIIKCAKKQDTRPLYILVWGSITDIAQALHDAPEIKSNIRVHFIASWNQRQDENAFKYIDTFHQDLWMIHDNTTFRGWYVGGDQPKNFDNESFVKKHINKHGALGRHFARQKNGSIKMGDTPTVARLLYGNPANPGEPSWGGEFEQRLDRAHWWQDIQDEFYAEGQYKGAKTVNKWRMDYLTDWQKRMDRCK